LALARPAKKTDPPECWHLVGNTKGCRHLSRKAIRPSGGASPTVIPRSRN
jgi:hypothetical protein